MTLPVIATKLYIPTVRPKLVLRPRLHERLTKGLQGHLTLISAPAGFGKSTLVSGWVQSFRHEESAAPAAAWLSLDEEDNDPARFLTYIISALQVVAPMVGQALLRTLHSPQPPPVDVLLATLLNELTTLPEKTVLILDDYHLIDNTVIDQMLGFLLEHLPPQVHLVIVTREDPQLPLARLRARNQMSELRVADLRFTGVEAGDFLNQTMGLDLSTEAINALETRTEGWIAGLQLAALSMQGQQDRDSFIQSFTGSHRFVLDYLVEEVLYQQPASIQTFLLRTSILNRLCGSLCDAVAGELETSRSQAILEYLEQANLFIVPLDNERRWYRYHHLFAELLRQRLQQSLSAAHADGTSKTNELHIRASQWLEANDLDIEAFQHAAAANDIERAERLIEGKGIPLHLRGAVLIVLNWLDSLPREVMNARPWLWWRHASLLLVDGQTTGVAEKLQAAEDAIAGWEDNEQTRYLIGRIAAARSVLALSRYDVESMFAQSQRALEYLSENYRYLRANAHWVLGVAYQFLGKRSAARRSHSEAITLSRASGDTFVLMLSTIGLGNTQEEENQLQQAVESYQRVLQLAGDQPLSIVNEAQLGLARIFYEWNNLQAAEQHGQQSLRLARLYDRAIDRFILSEIFLARLKLAQGDAAGAAAMLAQTEQSARQQNFIHRLPEIAAAQVVGSLARGNVADAAHLAQEYQLPIAQARVYLAQRNPSAALAVLDAYRQQMEAKEWVDERLRTMVLQTVALQAQGAKDKALTLLREVLALAEPAGMIRLFVDEGLPMAQLLSEAITHAITPHYSRKLLSAFSNAATQSAPRSNTSGGSSQRLNQKERKSELIEPLSERELEVLRLIAQGLSNQEIGERLFVTLSTVKGHNQRLFGKLQVQSRTEAIHRAQDLGLL